MTEIYHDGYDSAMRGFKIPLLITLIVSLGLGVGVGFKLRRERASQLGVVTSSKKLKVLALEGALPQTMSRGFRTAENIEVVIVEAPTPAAILKSLEADPNAFDVVTLRSSQTLKALQELKIQPVKASDISGFALISRDFVDLPGHLPNVVPFLWGIDIEIDDQTDVRSTGGHLWILNLALTSHSENVPEAMLFLAYVLRADVALEISTANHLASTNTSVESSTLGDTLKPSFLRQIPLTKLKLEN